MACAGETMKLTCLRTDRNCEHDADYETAVDLRHYTIVTEAALYELPNGARLLFEQITITTTGTYLEPDFNHLEATGNIVYVEHDDELLGTDTRTSACLYGLIPGRHGDEDNYGYGKLSDGWEVFGSFDPSKFAELEDWSAGVVACFPDQAVSSLVRAYDQRVSENWNAWLDQLCAEAMARIETTVANAYDVLGLVGEFQ